MKLLNRHELMKLPPGTIYQQYDPAILGQLMVKGETLAHDGENTDWFEGHVTADTYMRGMQFTLGCIEGREGNYSDELSYLVYEPEDVEHMIARLKGCTALVERTLPMPKD